MNTSDWLVEFHRRCHASFAKLLDHCATLTHDELHRSLPGLGESTVQLQVHHVIAAERYWLGVLQGRIDIDEDEADYPDIASLKAFRETVAAACERYLSQASEDELTRAREMTTWDGKRKLLVPAHIITRTQTHIFHHQGQILSTCRLLGKPAGGFDYPIEP